MFSSLNLCDLNNRGLNGVSKLTPSSNCNVSKISSYNETPSLFAIVLVCVNRAIMNCMSATFVYKMDADMYKAGKTILSLSLFLYFAVMFKLRPPVK